MFIQAIRIAIWETKIEVELQTVFRRRQREGRIIKKKKKLQVYFSFSSSMQNRDYN